MRIIEVKNCGECPHRYLDETILEVICLKNKQSVMGMRGPNDFPAHCPLKEQLPWDKLMRFMNEKEENKNDT